jgi:hypothetical protein
VLYVLKAERSEQGERHSQADPESALWIGSVRGHKLAAELLDGVTHSSYFSLPKRRLRTSSPFSSPGAPTGPCVAACVAFSPDSKCRLAPKAQSPSMLVALRHTGARRILELNAVAQRNPLKTSLGVTSAKACLADLFTQNKIERREHVDPQRLATFTLFGFVYQGGIQYWMVNVLWERLFPGSGLVPAAQKILAMNLISDPVFFFPTFYTMRTVLANPHDALHSPYSVVSTALSLYKERCFEDWRNSWVIWIPGHMITYGVMPMHLRMPWVASLSFSYMCILSYTRGDKER